MHFGCGVQIPVTLVSPCAGPFNHQTQAFPCSCVQVRAPLLKSSRLQPRHCCSRISCMALPLFFSWVSEMRHAASISRISCCKLTCGFSPFLVFFLSVLCVCCYFGEQRCSGWPSSGLVCALREISRLPRSYIIAFPLVYTRVLR